MDKRTENKKMMVTINLVMNFFVETIVGAVIGFFLGRFLDNTLFGEKQILVFVLLVLGLLGGLANFIKRVLKNIDDGGSKDEKS